MSASDLEALVQRIPVPLLGLPESFAGARWISDITNDGTMIGLGHGQRSDEGPKVITGVFVVDENRRFRGSTVSGIDVYDSLGRWLLLAGRTLPPETRTDEERRQWVGTC